AQVIGFTLLMRHDYIIRHETAQIFIYKERIKTVFDNLAAQLKKNN
ncbi:27324_t:CDS:1, partial [Racocetra persica]